LKLEYQYTGDYLRLYPFNFIKNLGFTGQPNETFLYGVGNDAVSYLLDGVSYNDRQSNSLNLNLIQSEDVDSIEMIPLPRGFLYGAYNNPVSVNFITKDFIPILPYSRIRFYQGTNRDMMFDGIFNAVVTKKLIASFDITNRIYDGTYANTDYSIWQGKIKLRYLLSNAVNIIASYSYNDYNAGYSGGVNVDSIKSLGENVDNVLYDFRAAPMVYPNGELKTLTHLPRLRFLIKPTEWMKSDASLFFMFNRYEKNTSTSDYSESKTYGLNIRNDFDYNVFKFQLNVDYEKRDIYSSRTFYNSVVPAQSNTLLSQFNADLFSVSGILSANLDDDTFIPSVFYKTSSYKKEYSQPADFNSSNNGQGVGVDLLFKIKQSFGLYLGTSILKSYNSSKYEYALIELGMKYQDEFVFADLKYFYNEYDYGFYTDTGLDILNYIRFGYVNGLGLNLKFNYWKLLLESNSSYYFAIDNDKLIGVPEFQTQTGLYFKSILFNSNLDLKTGFVFYYTGTNNVFTNEHGVIEVSSSYKLDFTLAGEIQKVAIVYFLWQNLLQNNYYITPYYPMPTSNIRFGFAWELFN
ncbi:MAG TPA: putative porin, partial [Ignavibacteriaceae bacterium]